MVLRLLLTVAAIWYIIKFLTETWSNSWKNRKTQREADQGTLRAPLELGFGPKTGLHDGDLKNRKSSEDKSPSCRPFWQIENKMKKWKREAGRGGTQNFKRETDPDPKNFQIFENFSKIRCLLDEIVLRMIKIVSNLGQFLTIFGLFRSEGLGLKIFPHFKKLENSKIRSLHDRFGFFFAQKKKRRFWRSLGHENKENFKILFYLGKVK